MRIFVTGSTGFVGRALSQFLTSQGHEVVGLVHDLYDMQSFTNLPNPPFRCFFGDIRSHKRMREILFKFKPDAIIHLAAQAIVSRAEENSYGTYDVNVNGTLSLLNAWHECVPNAWFLNFSTDKVYGEGLNKKETDSIVATGNAYTTSKAAADLIAQSYGATVTRSCNIYGPGDREQSRIIPSVIHSLLLGETAILRYPEAEREYIYINDLCTIIQRLLEQRVTGIWNIGSGKVAPTWEVATEILQHFPKLEWREQSHERPKNELNKQSLNTEKLCGQVDCLSFMTLKAGIAETVKWWKTQYPS